MKKTTLLFLLLTLTVPFAYATESVTLTTYYPAPAGSYQSMRSTKMCIGTNCHSGTAAAADNNLYVQNNIGIGTTVPTTRLTIRGLNTSGLDRTIGLYNDGTGSGSSTGVVFSLTSADLATPQNGRVASVGMGTITGHFGDNVTAGDLSMGTMINRDLHFMTRVDIDGDNISDISPTRLIIKNNGNVGIGTIAPIATLDVSGPIKIGTTNSCTAAKDGLLRYTSANKFEYCDGPTLSWQPMGGGSAGLSSYLGVDSGNTTRCLTNAGTFTGNVVCHDMGKTCRVTTRDNIHPCSYNYDCEAYGRPTNSGDQAIIFCD